MEKQIQNHKAPDDELVKVFIKRCAVFSDRLSAMSFAL